MKTNQELLKELRALTSAGMKDCKDALEANGWDLAKAADAVKVKGLQNTTSREGRVASEGIVQVMGSDAEGQAMVMVEINCQTDFVARSPEFLDFTEIVLDKLASAIYFPEIKMGGHLDLDTIELDSGTTVGDVRRDLIALTRENIQIRRWWAQQVEGNNRTVHSYVHSNNKLGVLVAFESPSVTVQEFKDFADSVAMQIAAMNPLAVSRENLPAGEFSRQGDIFEAQLTELNKPKAAWPKIIEGKYNKWFGDVCLLDQESVVSPKKTVGQLADELSVTLSKAPGNVKILSFSRCQVGEGVEKTEENFADEVAKLSGVTQ